MEHLFRISAYDVPALQDQTSLALEKRIQLISRKKFPVLWKLADILNFGTPIDEIPSKRDPRQKKYGFILLVLGIVLLVPGLVKANAALSFFGAVGVLAGARSLWQNRQSHMSRFDRSAHTLLSGLERSQGMTVCFSGEGMSIDGRSAVPYDNFEYILVSQDLIMFTWDGQIAVLQKKDLETGSADMFCAQLRQKLGDKSKYISLIPDRPDVFSGDTRC